MATTTDYSAGKVITIENIIDPAKATACDAGTPSIRQVVEYKTIEKNPCTKFNYLFDANGQFLTNGKQDGDKDYLVEIRVKQKNTARLVPSYRQANSKLLQPGDKIKFATTNKDEIFFYEKFAEKYDGELKVTIADS